MQILTFLKKAAAFAIINTIILVATLVYFSGKNRNIHLNIANTESNLLSMGENQHYDFAILGTSRGRVFSRDDNHEHVEKLLNKSFINLAKGGGGGLMPAKLHLSHFYSRGNTVDQIFYLIDPWIFYSPINNEKNNFSFVTNLLKFLFSGNYCLIDTHWIPFFHIFRKLQRMIGSQFRDMQDLG